MAQYWRRLDTLVDLTTALSASTTATIASDGTDDTLLIDCTSGSGDFATVRYDEPGAIDATAGVIECAVLMRQSAVSGARGGGSKLMLTLETGVAADVLAHWQYGADGNLAINTGGNLFTHAIDTTAYFWASVRFDRAAAQAEARIWTGAITDRPATANKTAAASGQSATKWAGVLSRLNTGQSHNYHTLALATEGDPLPSGPPVTRRFLPLLLAMR